MFAAAASRTAIQIPDNYQPQIYARDVLEMMAALDIPRAVFLGTSMGGIITMTLAAMRPKAIAAAILNDVGPAIAPEGIARILGYVGKVPAGQGLERCRRLCPPDQQRRPARPRATRSGNTSPSAHSAQGRRTGAGL